LDKHGECFRYLRNTFPQLAEGKLKEGIFIGPQIRTLMNDATFETTMTTAEKMAWISFKNVLFKFLGNYKNPDYVAIVEDMLENYKKLGCRMSVKLHFLHSHLDFFPENLRAVSEEQGERFHQDIKDIERKYQGRWDVSMLAKYCWLLTRDDMAVPHNRKASKRAFKPN